MGARDLLPLFGVLALAALARSVVEPILPLHLAAVSVSPALIGLLFSIAMVMQGVGEVFWGWVADRTGLVIPLGLGTLMSGLTVMTFSWAGSELAMAVLFAAWGFCRSAVYGPGRGIIGARAPASRKSTYLAATFAVTSASRSVGAFPGGLMADRWGYSPVFAVSAAMAAVSAMVVAVALRGLGPTTSAAAPFSDARAPSRLRPRAFLSLGLATALHHVGFGVAAAFLPLLAAGLGASATEVGILFTLRGITVMALSLPLGALADRGSKKALMLKGLAVSAVAMGLMAWGRSLGWLYAGVLASSLGQSLYSPAALGHLSSLVPGDRQATAMGIYGGLYENGGIILGLALGGLAWSLGGPQAAFLLGMAAATGGAVLMARTPADPQSPALTDISGERDRSG